MKALWKYEVDYGRMGTVEGVFVATDEEIQEALGKEAYFGEILGKHSEVICTLDMGELTRMCDDQDFISRFESLGLSSGYNPLDYIEA